MKNWKEAILDKDLFWGWDKETLTQDDWDFHWLNEKSNKRKKEAVMLYEYAREQNQIRELGEIPQGDLNSPSVWDDYPLLCEWPFGHEVLKYFPQTPAKKIPNEVVNRMVIAIADQALRTFDFSSIRDMQQLEILEKKPTHSGAYKRTETVEIAAFEIDRELSHSELKRRFGKWLNMQVDRAKVKKRTSKDALLKALGIYRLLNAHKNFNDASSHACTKIDKYSYLEDYLYKGEEEWSKAKVKAFMTIERLYPPYL